MVMRHAFHPTNAPPTTEHPKNLIPGNQLGCYFCSDVVAPTNVSQIEQYVPVCCSPPLTTPPAPPSTTVHQRSYTGPAVYSVQTWHLNDCSCPGSGDHDKRATASHEVHVDYCCCYCLLSFFIVVCRRLLLFVVICCCCCLFLVFNQLLEMHTLFLMLFTLTTTDALHLLFVVLVFYLVVLNKFFSMLFTLTTTEVLHLLPLSLLMRWSPLQRCSPVSVSSHIKSEDSCLISVVFSQLARLLNNVQHVPVL